MFDSLYFDDFSLGQKFISKSRTVTEADLVNFAAVTWDHNSLHTDAEYAKQTPYKKRIAHGILGIAMHAGLTSHLTADSILALLSLSWDFKKPVFIGDTIHVEQIVKEMRQLSDGSRGVLTFAKKVINQNGEVVQQGLVTVLLAMRNK
ncbi:MAG: dehydratase [Desulfarculus sp.]|jgi:acyl dehydratase|nr:MAG: dehydratase [Desulfarculus sp.]